MNPVVGLDVSKGESQVQAFLDKSQPYGKSFSISHTREGLDTFLHFLKLMRSMLIIYVSCITRRNYNLIRKEGYNY